MNWTFWTRTPPAILDDCGAIDPLLSLYADGMASVEEARRVKAHLPVCAACRESLAWMRATQRALASRPVVSPPADLRARIASAIAASSAAPVPASFNVRRAFAVRPAYAAAASVVLLGVAGYGLLHHPVPAVAPPVMPPRVAAAPQAGPSTPVIKTAGPSVKPHVMPHPVVAPKHAAPNPDLVAVNPPHKAAPLPSPVKTRAEARVATKIPTDDVPAVAPNKSPAVTITKPATRKARPEMMAKADPMPRPAKARIMPTVRHESVKPDTVVAEAPHATAPSAPSLIEKPPVITQDPAPTVTVAGNGGGRFQTAEEHGVIKLHLAMQSFTHATFKIDKSVALAAGLGPDRSRTQTFVSTP